MFGRTWPQFVHFVVLVFVGVLAPFSLSADDAGVARRNAKRELEEAARLVRQYSRARDSLSIRQQVVERSVAAGPRAAVAVLLLVDREYATLHRRYLSSFYRGINASPKIDVETVLTTHESLTRDRERLAQWEAMAAELRPFRGPSATPVSSSSDSNELPEFETFLSEQEQKTLDQWLFDKGYERLTDSEVALIAATNRYREKEGLPALEIDYGLCVAARDHSLDMTRENFFSHTSKVEGKRSHVQRAARFGTTAVSENIASCLSPAQAFTLWQASPPHDRNMKTRVFRRIGVGHVGKKYTMMFGL